MLNINHDTKGEADQAEARAGAAPACGAGAAWWLSPRCRAEEGLAGQRANAPCHEAGGHKKERGARDDALYSGAADDAASGGQGTHRADLCRGGEPEGVSARALCDSRKSS